MRVVSFSLSYHGHVTETPRGGCRTCDHQTPPRGRGACGCVVNEAGGAVQHSARQAGAEDHTEWYVSTTARDAPAIARARTQVLSVAFVAQHAACGGAWVSWREVTCLTVFLGLLQTRVSSSQAPWAAWYVPHSLGESITVAMAHAHGRKLTAGGVQMVCAAGWRGGGPAVRHHQSPHANSGP